MPYHGVSHGTGGNVLIRPDWCVCPSVRMGLESKLNIWCNPFCDRSGGCGGSTFGGWRTTPLKGTDIRRIIAQRWQCDGIL